MMDYNLQGMNFLHLRLAKFRQFEKPCETSTNDEESLRKLDKSERRFSASTLPSHLLLPDHVARVSSCELEIDGLAPDILNTNSSLLSHSLLGGSAPARLTTVGVRIPNRGRYSDCILCQSRPFDIRTI
jgi:hypothetical protein